MVAALRLRALSFFLLCVVFLGVGGAANAFPAPRQLGDTATTRLVQVTGHDICCASYLAPIKALAVLDLALTVVPGADAAKLLEVGVKGAVKAGGEQLDVSCASLLINASFLLAHE
jgi:hypothetical protein